MTLRASVHHAFGLLTVIAIPLLAVPVAIAAPVARWENAPEAFVVIRDDAPGGMHGFVRALEAAGGHAAVVYPPGAAVVFADAAALAQPAVSRSIAAAERGQIARPGALGASVRRAAEAWNASLELAAAVSLESAQLGPAAEIEPPHGPDAGPRPAARPWQSAPPHINVSSSHLPYGADYYDTSEFMAGSVAVGVWLLEAPAASTYHWSPAEEAQTIAGVQSGLANWVRKGGPAAFLTFYIETHTLVPVNGTPIQNPQNTEQTWIGQALGNAGWPGASAFDKCYAYNDAIRDTFDTNWAYSIFIVDSDPNVNQGLFSTGGYAWAYYGGPWVYMSRVSSWAYGYSRYYAAVPMHESGHIFFDTDEYDGSLQYNGYFNAPDDPAYPQCIMNQNDTTRVCPLTRVQLGWRDLDANGVIDPLGAPPPVAITPVTPDPTFDRTPTWNGTAHVATIPNQNPYSSYFPPHAMTVATISNVECRIDGGPWTGATASDGAFDGYDEAFEFTALPLAAGPHVIEARAVSSVGVASADYARDTVVVNAPLAVEPGATTRFRLFAPRPNPARAAAELRFTLPERRTIDAEVLDLGGRRIRVLAAGRVAEPGAGALVWDGRDGAGAAAPAGVYVMRMRAGGETQAERIVIAR